ncbi:hypothetical protein STVA_00460 [Allostella vacuolata]|nr:hypothetical protein STVA_00460 [Stella vacuolata]
MVTRRHFLRSVTATAALAAGGLPLAGIAGERSPVVVELFTSQGCSSCPAADKFLHELSGRGDVIALSLHVDYWNYMGWVDPFSRSENSARQRGYKAAMGLRYVYTPQMVVDGRAQAVGTDREAVERLIREATIKPHLPIALNQDGTTIIADLPAGDAATPAVVWLAIFERTRKTVVDKGENSGRSIVNTHVVRSIVPIGEWMGEAVRLTYVSDVLNADRGAAVIVQKKGFGPILGAAMIRPPTS